MKLLDSVLVALLRTPGLGALLRRLLIGVRDWSIRAMKRADKRYVRPRNWSNAELRRFAPAYDGKVINVSGWRDEDQEGGHYGTYFARAQSYVVSNYRGGRASEDVAGELFLDLERRVPVELQQQFQVVFNHTTLEHLYDIRTAVANLCALSHDTVILVTPFLQQVHFEPGSYGDYWRPTPACLERMLAEHGFEVIYQSSNDNEWHIVYVFTVATRRLDRYRGTLPFARIGEAVGVRHFNLA